MKKKTLNTEYSADLSPNFGGASVMDSRYLGEWDSEADDYMFCLVEDGGRKIGVCPVDFLGDDEVCNLMIEHSVGAVVFRVWYKTWKTTSVGLSQSYEAFLPLAKLNLIL